MVVDDPARKTESGVEAMDSAFESLNTPAPASGANCSTESVTPAALRESADTSACWSVPIKLCMDPSMRMTRSAASARFCA